MSTPTSYDIISAADDLNLNAAPPAGTITPPYASAIIKPKKRGSFNVFKAALLMIRSNSKKKPSHPQLQAPATTGKWKKLVGSMRPLHLQDNQSPPPSLPALSPSPTVESFDELLAPRASSSSSSSPSSISGGTMSQYASANNLQELDVPDDSDEEEDPDEVFDAITGDENIDSKAEEFIAQFYRQMKLQNVGAMYHH